MAEESTIHRSTVRLEKPIYDVPVDVALENHLHTPRRGPNIKGGDRLAGAGGGRVEGGGGNHAD